MNYSSSLVLAKHEKIAKQLVFVWDGSRPTEVEAAWRLVDRSTGKAVAEGSRRVALEPFEIRFEPVELAPPPAKKGARADYRLEVAFAGDRVAPDDRTDSFDLSVYPEPLRGTRAPDPIGKVALFDPRGESGPVLDGCASRFCGTCNKSLRHSPRPRQDLPCRLPFRCDN